MSDKQLVKMLRAMGNERRFSILKHLYQKKKLSVSKISELIKLSFRSVSHHLSILSDAGLIEAEQVNLNRFYFISPELSKDITKFFV